MSSRSQQAKLAELQRELEDLIDDYRSASRQYSSALGAVERRRIKRLMENLEEEMEETEKRIDSLKSSENRGASRSTPAIESFDDAEITFDDSEKLIKILAKQAVSSFVEPKLFFRNLIAQLNLPDSWAWQLAGVWTGSPPMDARQLLGWIKNQRDYPKNHSRADELIIVRLLEVMEETPGADNDEVEYLSSLRNRLTGNKPTPSPTPEPDNETQPNETPEQEQPDPKPENQNSETVPFPVVSNGCILSIQCQPDRPISIDASGDILFSSTTRQSLDINVPELVRETKNAYRHPDFSFYIQKLGRELYKKLFGDHSELSNRYSEVLGSVGRDAEKLHLVFKTERDFFGIPFELLFKEGDDYLALKHPLSRSLMNNPKMRDRLLSPDFFNKLVQQNEKLKILLIASNTKPDIPGVDQEIKALDERLPTLFQRKGIEIDVTTLPTEKATYRAVRAKIKNNSYHIIHYAGHGFYDEASPEKSHLSFWEEENKKSSVIKDMMVSELKMLLERSKKLCFVYLSCCEGSESGEASQLLDNIFLGIADGVIKAGVPNVLGFRWRVNDISARKLSLAFYTSLAEKGRLEMALLEARREVAGPDRDDKSWISPILLG